MSLQTNSQNNKGFTLIELLIVIAIIGILASITLVMLNPNFIFGQTRDARRKSDLKQIANALQLYYNDNKQFPNCSSSVTPLCNVTTNNWVPVTGLGLSPSYARTIPSTPDSSWQANYEYMEPGALMGCQDNQAYAIRARLSGNETGSHRWCDGTSATSLNTPGYFYILSD
jgi:type II secretion system protein G